MMNKKIVGWGDIVPETQELLMMEKDVFDGRYDRQWPMAGSKLSVELISQSARSLRFYLDVIENKRETSLVMGLAPNRKCTMQHRRAAARCSGSITPRTPTRLGIETPMGL